MILPKSLQLLRENLCFDNDDSQKKRIQLTESQWEILLLVLMILYGFLCTVLVDLGGSTHLLGSFVGGLGFASVEGAGHVWENRVLPVRQWLSSLFFASIGFSIPLSIFEPKGLLYGFIYTIVSFFTKLVCGFWASPLKQGFWVIGTAMVGRYARPMATKCFSSTLFLNLGEK